MVFMIFCATSSEEQVSVVTSPYCLLFHIHAQPISCNTKPVLERLVFEHIAWSASAISLSTGIASTGRYIKPSLFVPNQISNSELCHSEVRVGVSYVVFAEATSSTCHIWTHTSHSILQRADYFSVGKDFSAGLGLILFHWGMRSLCICGDRIVLASSIPKRSAILSTYAVCERYIITLS